ncbi:MAG: PilZ domain-containing protein [Rhodanobacteraceae bacterium]
MANDAWQSFNDRIAWEGTVHVECEILDAPLDSTEIARLEAMNARVLTTLDTLGDRGGEPQEDETAVALARIDTKLNVLLEMFNRHLLGHLQLPPRRTVRFNARGILIEDWTPPDPGTAMLVRMHFDACIGLPLELPGHTATSPQHVGGFVTFDALDDDVRQSIEHLVFRQHRRQLADARRESQPPPR